MADMIPLSVPNLVGNEEKYMVEALRAGWVSTNGSYVTAFEQAVSSYCETPGAVACQSGTAGLHIALMLAGVTQGDSVLVPTLTFIAAVNPVSYIGAHPIFMDCDDTLCMDPEKVRAFCEQECHVEDNQLIENLTGRTIKAMLIVHVFGNLADMDALMALADKYHLKMVEDATESLGTICGQGKYAGKSAGTIGDIGVLSFNGNKIITTGGGGMILSMDMAVLRHAKHLTTQAKADELYYLHNEVGYNYRMTNVQAAIGVAQMELLPGFIETKQRNYQLYCDGLRDIPGLRLLPLREGNRSNHWFYALFIEDSFAMKRDALIHYLQSKQIQTRPIWGLIHEQVPYTGYRAYRMEKAPFYYEHVLNLPCSTDLQPDQVKRILSCLRDAR